MNGWMGEDWMDEWMSEDWMDEWMDGLMGED